MLLCRFKVIDIAYMNNPAFNEYPFDDHRKYKPFSFSLAVMISIEIEMKQGTTYINRSETNEPPKNAGDALINVLSNRCNTQEGEYAYDSTLIRKLREMDIGELLIAIHGMEPRDLVIPA
jgi:hypothetical protein